MTQENAPQCGRVFRLGQAPPRTDLQAAQESPNFGAMRYHLLLLVTLFGLLPSLAHAQWVATGRWGDDRRVQYVQPGTWMFLDSGRGTQPGASLHVEGEHHDTRLELRCSGAETDPIVVFSGYRGFALPAFDQTAPTDPITVTLTLDGRDMPAQLQPRPSALAWELSTDHETNLVNDLTRTRRLTLAIPEGEQLASYRLRGGRAARRSFQRACGA